MWDELGFKQNPYDHLPVSASASGERLLVGRQKEVDQLTLRIRGRNAIPTLEGEIGVGKTSIISIAAYKLEKAFWAGDNVCHLAIERPFQLDSTESPEQFASRVYQSILIKLHVSRQRLVERGVNIGETRRLHSWLTSEQYSSPSFQIGGSGGGLNTTPNTSQGFSTLGFQNQVNQLMKSAFPNSKRGGVICIIDNLELLEKSRTAQAAIEAMRDKLLTAHGVIWVICGARGIVRGVASSTRLQGYLSRPIEIRALPRNKLDGLIDKRIGEYAYDATRAVAPVEQAGFDHIFAVSNDNLRTALKFCADFSEWFFENGSRDASSQEKYELLEVWLSEEADEFNRAINLTPKPIEIFDKIVDEGGSVSPSDHGKFGYETTMAMRPQVKALEEAGLVESTIDESDQRRRTISLTPKGWIVHYSRRGYPSPQGSG